LLSAIVLLRFATFAPLRINPARPPIEVLGTILLFSGRFSGRKGGDPVAVQLVSDEVHVVTGEPWRHWFDDRSWDRILDLALSYGFVGARMEPGTYVDEVKAGQLADALEKALPDIPDHDSARGRTEWIGDYHLPTTDVSSTEWFSGPAKIYYEEFIRHCRAGGFRVEYDASRPGI
jgi:hypothetical protein